MKRSNDLTFRASALVLGTALVAAPMSCGEKAPADPPATPSASGGRAGTGGSRPGGSGGSAPNTGGTVGGTGGGAGGQVATGGSGGGAVGGAGGGGGGAEPDATVDVPQTLPEAGSEAGNAAGAFRIYWIDVEGGAATLLIAPTGETLLADSGWQNTTNRIVSTIERETGGKKLDYFLATHYHVDHITQAPGLASALTIANFIDHGASVEGGSDGAYRTAVMRAMSTAKRMTVEPGTKFMLGGVEITIVTSARKVATLPTAIANPACDGASMPGETADEDPQSVGFVARYGKFEFVDLGDLTGGVEHRLACPMNQVGQIELFQSSQHGSSESNPVTLLHGLSPQVIVVNNGASKGGDGPIFERFKRVPGLKDLWAVHRKTSNSAAQNADPELIANDSGPDMGHWIRATVQADGSFSVTNGRTMMSRTYMSR